MTDKFIEQSEVGPIIDIDEEQEAALRKQYNDLIVLDIPKRN